MTTRILAVAIAVLFVASVAAAEPTPACEAKPDTFNITLANGKTPAKLGDDPIWVFPTGKTPDDCGHIQWAVNNVASGGTVFLKKYDRLTYEKITNDKTYVPSREGLIPIFNLNDSITPEETKRLHVGICQNVTIEGEITEKELKANFVGKSVGVKEGTMVSGGQQTFYVGGSLSCKDNYPFITQPSVTIKNIRFVGAAPGPIKFNGGSGHSEVSGCSIVDYKYGKTVSGGHSGAFPIVADPGDDGPEGLTGTFIFEENYIGPPPPPVKRAP